MSLDPAWYGRDRATVKSVFRGQARNIHLVGRPWDRWESYGADLPLANWFIRAFYPVDYPYHSPHVTLSPAPASRHYYDHHEGLGLGPTLCYLRPSEWSPQYTMATALWITIRFLNQFENGLVD